MPVIGSQVAPWSQSHFKEHDWPQNPVGQAVKANVNITVILISAK